MQRDVMNVSVCVCTYVYLCTHTYGVFPTFQQPPPNSGRQKGYIRCHHVQCSHPDLHKHSHTHTDPAIARTRYHRPPCGAAVVCDQLMVTRVQFCHSVTAVSHRPVTAESRVRSQVSLCKICGAQSVTVTDFSPSTSVFPCQYHSTNAPYPFIHLPPTLYNVSLPVLQFSPVSTIPPMLHSHSFTYHPRYIMFLTQHFSFPLSVPFHQCCTLTCILFFKLLITTAV